MKDEDLLGPRSDAEEIPRYIQIDEETKAINALRNDPYAQRRNGRSELPDIA